MPVVSWSAPVSLPQSEGEVALERRSWDNLDIAGLGKLASAIPESRRCVGSRLFDHEQNQSNRNYRKDGLRVEINH